MIWSIGEGANEVEAKDFVRVGKEWVGNGLAAISGNVSSQDIQE